MQNMRRDRLSNQLRLIHTKMIEDSHICLMLSLYLHKFSNGQVAFSFYSEYLGFGIQDFNEFENIENAEPKSLNILSGQKHIFTLSDEDIEDRKKELIQKMDKMTFKETFDIIVNYQNQIFV